MIDEIMKNAASEVAKRDDQSAALSEENSKLLEENRFLWRK